MAVLWAPARSGLIANVWGELAELFDLFRRGALPPYCVPRRVTTDTTLLSTDRLLLVDSTAGAVVVNLPTAASMPMQPYAVKLIAGANNVTLDAAGTENIYTNAGGGTLAWNTAGVCKVIWPAVITAPATYGWVELNT